MTFFKNIFTIDTFVDYPNTYKTTPKIRQMRIKFYICRKCQKLMFIHFCLSSFL